MFEKGNLPKIAQNSNLTLSDKMLASILCPNRDSNCGPFGPEAKLSPTEPCCPPLRALSKQMCLRS